jgi:hypothetical protein
MIMPTRLKNNSRWKPNYLAIGIVLGICFMVAMENPFFIVIGLIIGVVPDRRHRETQL